MRDSGISTTSNENRRERRRRVLWAGLVFVPQSHSILDCVIKDLSDTGAKITFRGEVPLPIRFYLVDITNRAAYEVQSVRRGQREAGLKILRPVPLTDSSSIESLQLRQLLVERISR